MGPASDNHWKTDAFGHWPRSRSVRGPLPPKPRIGQPTNHGAEFIIEAKEPIRFDARKPKKRLKFLPNPLLPR